MIFLAKKKCRTFVNLNFSHNLVYTHFEKNALLNESNEMNSDEYTRLEE